MPELPDIKMYHPVKQSFEIVAILDVEKIMQTE